MDFMKYFIVFIILIFNVKTYCQNDSLGVYIEIEDCTTIRPIRKNIWVERENFIRLKNLDSTNFLKIWSDNGKIMNGNKFSYWYILKPLKPGNITIYTTYKNPKKSGNQTITTATQFTAVNPPKFEIKIIKGIRDNDSTIKFVIQPNDTVFFDYKIACPIQMLIFDEMNNYLGGFRIKHNNENSIDLTYKNLYQYSIKKGYKLRFEVQLWIRKYNLIIPTNVEYIIK